MTFPDGTCSGSFELTRTTIRAGRFRSRRQHCSGEQELPYVAIQVYTPQDHLQRDAFRPINSVPGIPKVYINRLTSDKHEHPRRPQRGSVLIRNPYQQVTVLIHDPTVRHLELRGIRERGQTLSWPPCRWLEVSEIGTTSDGKILGECFSVCPQ